MRHLRLEVIFLLYWALRHTIVPSDNPGELHDFSRANLRELPQAFWRLIENLDPSAFWISDEASAFGIDVPSVEKLLKWNRYIDEYMCTEGKNTFTLFFLSSNRLLPQKLLSVTRPQGCIGRSGMHSQRQS